MTTMTHSQFNDKRTPSKTGFIWLLGLIILAIMVVPAAHAVERHGEEAVIVRKCVREGPTINFKDTIEDNKFYLVCKLPDGSFGVQVIIRVKKVLQEKTAYIMENKNWDQVVKYVTKSATRYKGPLP